MSRRPDAIDLVKLQAEWSHREWNQFLTGCLRTNDLEKLALTRNRLQRGMDLAAKKKLNCEKLQLLFIRLQTSIENTMRQIVRKKYPSPCDNPLIAGQHMDELSAKRLRDQELERYLKRTSF